MLEQALPPALLLARDERYPFDAYVFVFEALRFAQEKLGMGAEYLAEDDEPEFDPEQRDLPGNASDPEGEPERHVSGQELCEAMPME